MHMVNLRLWKHENRLRLEKGIFGGILIIWITLILYLLSFSLLNPYYEYEMNTLMKANFNYQTFINKSNVGGPYNVYKSTIYVGGFICGKSQNAIVYYPSSNSRDSSKRYPLISFAHGFRAGGHKLDDDYSQLLVGLASWGFIIVAPESAPTRYCEDQYEDQLRVFEYVQSKDARKLKALNLLDHSAYYGVLGHSMGGRSSIISATKDDYPIGASAALNPVYTQACARIKIPILYGTGTNDIFVPPGIVKECYEETPDEVQKIYVNIQGATHYEPGKRGHDYWPDYLAAFFSCHLLQNKTLQHIEMASNACQRVYGRNSHTCDLCVCEKKVPIESCKTNVMLIY